MHNNNSDNLIEKLNHISEKYYDKLIYFKIWNIDIKIKYYIHNNIEQKKTTLQSGNISDGNRKMNNWYTSLLTKSNLVQQ